MSLSNEILQRIYRITKYSDSALISKSHACAPRDFLLEQAPTLGASYYRWAIGRVPGETFAAKPTKDAEMEKLLRSMEGMPGAPGMKMYSRDDLMNNNIDDDEEDSDDDDDDNNNDGFAKKFEKILNQKSNTQQDLKEKIVQGIKKTGNSLKGHVNNVTQQIRNWWKRSKTGSKSSDPPFSNHGALFNLASSYSWDHGFNQYISQVHTPVVQLKQLFCESILAVRSAESADKGLAEPLRPRRQSQRFTQVTLSSRIEANTFLLQYKIIEEAKKGEEGNAKIAKLIDEHAFKVLQGTRVAPHLPLLDKNRLEDLDFLAQDRVAQDAQLVSRRKREGTLLAEEFLVRGRAENAVNLDYEYLSDASETIIINAWLNHGQQLKNIDNIYSSEEWIKHLKRNSLKERIFKENLVKRNNTKKMPLKYLPKPFLYFRRQKNKAQSAKLIGVAEDESSSSTKKRKSDL
ncbi:hypothetical protein KSP40_PGU011126 [Platanthera guangdongensis]|uniref:Uncharacterized protein n=1 Tax=Platanthera guangdongensis TaxID=2320717 RepID=A0ABR2LJ25_9ASPA